MSASREIEYALQSLRAESAGGDGIYLDPQAAEALLTWLQGLLEQTMAMERATLRPEVQIVPADEAAAHENVVEFEAWRRAHPFRISGRPS